MKAADQTGAAAAVAADAAESKADKPAKIRVGKRSRRGQAWGFGVGAASETVAKALARGIADWNERQDKSARKKKDGAINDAFENWTRAASKTLRKAGGAPEDFYEGVDKVWTGSYRKFFWYR